MCLGLRSLACDPLNVTPLVGFSLGFKLFNSFGHTGLQAEWPLGIDAIVEKVMLIGLMFG